MILKIPLLRDGSLRARYEVQSTTALECSRRANKNIEGIPISRGRWGGRGHSDGQCELQCRAPFPIRTSPPATSVRLDNPPTDGQSHAGTLRLGGEERIEYTIDFSHREADA